MPRVWVLGLSIAVVGLLMLTLPAPAATQTALPSVAPLAPAAIPQVSSPPNPFYNGMPATLALGAPNLTGIWDSTPPNASSFIPDPELACVDASGDIWVPNYPAGRVLEFKAPFSFKEAAAVIIGQPNASAYAPNSTRSGLGFATACAFDSHGDLWVSDSYNARVLEFVPPFSTGMNASLVIGQSTFTGSHGAVTATNFSDPTGLTFDANGDLWVADAGAARVLEFRPPFSNGMAASLVLGQSTFTTSGAGLSASNLSYPIGVAYADGILWVSDFENARVVGFAAPFSTGEGATYLLGQASFSAIGPTIGRASLLDPSSVSVDARGNVWVSDYSNNRVLEFAPPYTTFENASVVIGQSTFTGSLPGTTATNLSEPLGAFVAPNGALWISDAANVRVLEYVPATYSVTFHISGLPSATNWSVIVDGAAHSTTTANISLSEVNGTYAFSVPTLAGYRVTPTSGNVTVNDAGTTVSLTAVQVTYSVVFSQIGLPSTLGWTVTLGGVPHSSTDNGSISFTQANGTFAYAVSNVSGYTVSPAKGSVTVNGLAEVVTVAFIPVSSSSSSSSSPWYSNTEALLALVVALVVGLVVGLLIGRRRKGGSSTPAAQWTPPPPSPGAPPPAAPPPPGPAPPPGAGGPPPGAVG